MATDVNARDWEVQGVAQVGGVDVVGAGLFMFEFRSKHANFRGPYVFGGGALGLGGSLGGGSGPSPADVATNTQPNAWTAIKCTRDFSAEDLNWAYAALSVLGAGAAYGYSLLGISAGLTDELFRDIDVSGWGTGVGAVGAIMVGVWKQMGGGNYY